MPPNFILAGSTYSFPQKLDSYFCVEALESALRFDQPEIFNTDQGTQFTSGKFTGILEKRKISVSMDGRGRALDSVFIERLWRTLKCEEVYLRDYKTMSDAYCSLDEYFRFYNTERFYQTLDYQTPSEVYYSTYPTNARWACPTSVRRGRENPQIEKVKMVVDNA